MRPISHTAQNWDSIQLGTNCGSVFIPYDSEDTSCTAEEVLSSIPPEETLTVVKVPVSHQETLRHLLRNNTIMLGTEISFRFVANKRQTVQTGYTRILTTVESEPLAPLAEVMHYSRFMLDKRIPRPLALNLWRESIANHCNGRASILAVAYDEKSPAGLVAAVDRDDERNLFLVGVLPQYQGKGYGTDMLAAMVEQPGPPKITVEAFKENTPAVNLYLKAGFVPEMEHVVVHIWRAQAF